MDERRQHRFLESRVQFAHGVEISLDEFKSIALRAADAPPHEPIDGHEEEDHEEGGETGVDLVVVQIDRQHALSRVVSQPRSHVLPGKRRSLFHLRSAVELFLRMRMRTNWGQVADKIRSKYSMMIDVGFRWNF